MHSEDGTAYRAKVARSHYLVAEQWNIAFAVSQFAISMSKLSKADDQKVVRLAGYLKGQSRLVI